MPGMLTNPLSLLSKPVSPIVFNQHLVVKVRCSKFEVKCAKLLIIAKNVSWVCKDNKSRSMMKRL